MPPDKSHHMCRCFHLHVFVIWEVFIVDSQDLFYRYCPVLGHGYSFYSDLYIWYILIIWDFTTVSCCIHSLDLQVIRPGPNIS
jgi:hypothetical protein